MKELPKLNPEKPFPAAIEEQKEKRPKKKKKGIDPDTLKSAMSIKNIGDGIKHAASVYAASKKKKD